LQGNIGRRERIHCHRLELSRAAVIILNYIAALRDLVGLGYPRILRSGYTRAAEPKENARQQAKYYCFHVARRINGHLPVCLSG
jgi:hypothetical protein